VQADLILHGGRVWTVDPANPEARAVAVAGKRIVAVGSDDEVLALRGTATELVDLRGRLLLPGFIDAHTHFGNAAAWVSQVGLYQAEGPQAALALLSAAVRRMPEGHWITGIPAPQAIDRAALDAIAPRHPMVLRRADGSVVANSAAFARARFHGDPSGILVGRAGERMFELMPPQTLERRLVGARVALEDLARAGITSIHDVARDDALSQRHIFHTDVERSATDLELFRELQRRGQLTVRVYAFLTLPLWRDVVAAGVRPRTDEGLIRFGALKAFVDGFLMEDGGDFTFRFTDEATMAADVAAADAAGFDPVIHTIGDKAHRLLLDWYEAAIAANPPRDRRFRVIHAFYPSAREVERIGRLGLVVDVTPQQLVNDVATVEGRVGPERAARAHPWRELIDAGARLDLVSDWPGSYNEQRRTPLAPIENVALAVTRDWHPEQRLTVEEAVAAYTRDPAYASYEEDRKGTITAGKLADLVVLSRDILALPAAEIGRTEVDVTVLGGRVVHRRAVS